MCGRAAIDGMTHEACKRPQGMDGLVSLWFYKGVVRKSILKMKYQFAHAIANELASAFFVQIRKADKPLSQNAVLVPIPLHRQRKNWRGFNQVEEVGKIIAARMGWQFNADLLARIGKRTPQTELKKREQRVKNTIGIFEFNKDYSKLLSTSYQLLIFDDVWTTGATMREAAKVLKRNGAKNVWGLTLAH